MTGWTRIPAAAVLGAVMFAGAAQAAEHQVKMLNRGEHGMMVFEPPLLRIAPGDTVRFVPTNPSHNAESIRAMTPEGAPLFRGKMNEEIVVTFDRPGVYGYQCKPHYGMGMVGVVMVGEGAEATANLEQARAAAVPPKARDRFRRIFEQLGG